jgi:ADP-ribose pyrophosphatase
MSSSDPTPTLLGVQRAYEGRIVSVRHDHLRFADGREFRAEVVEHKPSIGVLVVDGADALLAVQYRHPTGEALLEIVAGGIDDGESAEEAANRELCEELGYRARSLIRLGGIWLAPGWCTEHMTLFLARDLVEERLEADEDEQITLERLPVADLYRRAESGDLSDAKTLAALLLARPHLSR